MHHVRVDLSIYVFMYLCIYIFMYLCIYVFMYSNEKKIDNLEVYNLAHFIQNQFLSDTIIINKIECNNTYINGKKSNPQRCCS